MNSNRAHLASRIAYVRNIVPLSLLILSISYQLVVAHRVHEEFGHITHLVSEILFYGTVGPLLTYFVIRRIEAWLAEKERDEIQARRTERRLATIMATSADAIISLDEGGNIEDWNLGAELMFDYAAEEMLGHSFQALFGLGPAAEVEYNWLTENVRKNGLVQGHETVCIGRDDQVLAVDITATQLFTREEVPYATSVILRDITQRKQREDELRQLNSSLIVQADEKTEQLATKIEELAQANADLQKMDQMRSEFVSLVSHQIRAPLTNMRGAVERMQNGCGVINATCTQMFRVLEEQVVRLDQLVQDMLDVSQIESGKLGYDIEPISVVPVLRQAATQFSTRASERPISLPTKPGLPLILADRNRVIEIMTNLLDNADKYSPEREEVVVDVRADEEEVTISVRDHGQGIPEDALGRVFDKFYRVDSSDSQAAYGYGLGLYICRNLVEAQGGRIWVENHPEGGARFVFTFPVWQREPS